MELIKKAFAQAKAEQRTPLVAYWTAGFPTNEDTVPIMLGMQRGGVEVVRFFTLFKMHGDSYRARLNSGCHSQIPLQMVQRFKRPIRLL